jgi:hypothetical protein
LLLLGEGCGLDSLARARGLDDSNGADLLQKLSDSPVALSVVGKELQFPLGA